MDFFIENAIKKEDQKNIDKKNNYGDKIKDKDKEKKKPYNAFTLFLILILLILSEDSLTSFLQFLNLEN